ncbi:GGDEF domain-containing response regulator [bacterium]|nr:GGDEF domain-containing response regulator [bacterium]
MERKILLIDKDEFFINFMQDRLQVEKFVVDVAKNTSEAYSKILSFLPDLIISAYDIEDIDGFQFCKTVKSHKILSRIPFLVLADKVKPVDKYWAEKCDVQEVLQKDTPYEEIRVVIDELLNEYEMDENTKEQIKNHPLIQDSVQNQAIKLMKSEIEKYTFLNAFRDMVNEYHTDEKALIQNTFDLLSVFLEYDLAGIFFNHAQEADKYLLHFDIKNCSVSSFVLEKVKRDFFAKMPNMKEFSITSFGHDIVNENHENLDKRIISANEFQSSLILPFEFEEKLIGGVCFYSKKEQNFMDFIFYDIMVHELTSLFKTSYLFSGIEFLSVTDGLTGLSNRRQFDYSINREFNKSRKYPSDLCFAILDIDHFKSVNDNYGHQYGDYVLKEVSSIIKNSFRRSDMIYRYGGEEIGIIMTETTIPSAMTMMERLRKKIETHEFFFNGIQISLTASIGVSSNMDKLEDAHQMIECADKALYKAKETGRNQVLTYSGEDN